MEELDDPKRAKKQQEAAEREAQRLIKNFKEIQKKADKKSKKKEKDIEQEIRKMEVGGWAWVGAKEVFQICLESPTDSFKFQPTN